MPMPTYRKTRVTVWPGSPTQTLDLGTVPHDKLEADILIERENHAGWVSTHSVEEVGTTLVVTKDTGAVHIYNWVL